MRNKLSYVLTSLIGILLLLSAAGKFKGGEDLLAGFQHLGIEPEMATFLGSLEAMVALLVLVPRTSFIGTILLTGYMGGAIFCHVRVHDLVIVQILVPTLAWVGFSLRNYAEVLALLGLKRPH